MQALITGFLTGLSLIVAIGAQNAFVLRQGLTRSNVFLVVLICSLSDALLIALGVLGLGTAIESLPALLEVVRWFGVGYLVWFGISSLRKAFKAESLSASDSSAKSIKQAVITTLSLTFLNPHVYLDTVIFVGGLSHQFGDQAFVFAIGAMTASFVWFFSLGFGATKLSPLMSKPIFWKILDSFIALVMFTIAISLAFFSFS
ncbi:MAG: amino acid transporter [Microbacteriaceae bacterium]|nr:amino acid transporter [Microbacteriaceae bacterium]